jgi:hypothetical protein
MGNFSDVGLLFLVLFLIGWPISIVMYLRDKKRRKHPWQQFAKAQGLKFVPDSFWGRYAYVEGSYEGYYLILGLDNDIRGGSYTHLGLTSPTSFGPGQPLTKGKMAQLFGVKPFPFQLKGILKTNPFGQKIYYEQKGIEIEVTFLNFLVELLHKVAQAYPAIVALGGEAIPLLQETIQNEDHPFSLIASQLLQDIVDDTTTRLEDQAHQTVCLECLTCYKAHKIPLSSWKSLTYYGCRTCGKSHSFFQGRVVALLDHTAAPVQQDGYLPINWLRRRKLFDFEEVYIIQASDEEVERFVVQVGNDTDPLRKARYEQMRCTIWPDCQLSENTRRILEYMFRVVKSKM